MGSKVNPCAKMNSWWTLCSSSFCISYPLAIGKHVGWANQNVGKALSHPFQCTWNRMLFETPLLISP